MISGQHRSNESQAPEDDHVDPLGRRAEDRVSRYREWERTREDDSRSSETQLSLAIVISETASRIRAFTSCRGSINFSIEEIDFRVRKLT